MGDEDRPGVAQPGVVDGHLDDLDVATKVAARDRALARPGEHEDGLEVRDRVGDGRVARHGQQVVLVPDGADADLRGPAHDAARVGLPLGGHAVPERGRGQALAALVAGVGLYRHGGLLGDGPRRSTQRPLHPPDDGFVRPIRIHDASESSSTGRRAVGAQAQKQGKDVTESPTAQHHPRGGQAHPLRAGLRQAHAAGGIEDESGEYRALVAYYFGNKQGLIDAIIDSLMDAEDEVLRERLAGIGDPDERVGALIDEQREISADWQGFRAFYSLPAARRDERLRPEKILGRGLRQVARTRPPTLAAGQPTGRERGPRAARCTQRGGRRGSRRPVRRGPGALRYRRGHLPPLAGHGARVPPGQARVTEHGGRAGSIALPQSGLLDQ